MPGIHRLLVNSSHKAPVTRKLFPFDDVIMDCNRLKRDDWSIRHTLKDRAGYLLNCPWPLCQIRCAHFLFDCPGLNSFDHAPPNPQPFMTSKTSNISEALRNTLLCRLFWISLGTFLMGAQMSDYRLVTLHWIIVVYRLFIVRADSVN